MLTTLSHRRSPKRRCASTTTNITWGYVNKLNELILDTPYAQQPLEDIVVSADGAIFNNAAQMWNHEFFFDQLSPDGERVRQGRC